MTTTSGVSPPEAADGDADLRGAGERRLRRAWRRGPGPALRAAGVLYALGAEARNFLHETGVLGARRASVPVISVGGLSAGGSGKTPVTAALAGELEARGRRPAVVTHGYADELEVHRRLGAGRIVVGGRDRTEAVERAADAGADLALVDSGLQHRRMARAVEVVAVGSRDARLRGRLPAGPMREGWWALGRADAVVLTRREGALPFPAGFVGWLRSRVPDAAVAACRLRPAGLVPSNRAAREVASPDPEVAVASVMHPAPFFRALRERGLDPGLRVRAPDHGRPDPDRLEAMIARAGDRGMVGTLKDVVKLEDEVGESTPLWHLRDEVAWARGRSALLRRIGRILEATA